ncbi:MAG: hypothetical protein DME57_01285 [Verrucomicrobia bacterium]|nr:MAG: hypothetical protein DME57_01285 [Verrucomicrobiota bacterium]
MAPTNCYMLMTGESLVVHYNFQRSFEKPPLQYWLTSFTLPRFQNPAVALRVWPILYGVLTSLALGWLVYLVRPNDPWLIPLAIAVLVSSPLFASESSRGLLDVGLTFFTLLTIVFAELARKKSTWWFAAAIACWLGSLQKMPVTFLVWLIILAVRFANREERAVLRSSARPLVGSMILAIALMSIWPLLQLLKYEMPVWSVYHDEVIVWLGPNELGHRPYFENPIAMSLAGGLSGFLSLVAPFLILFSTRERSSRAVREIAWVALGFLVLTIVTNFRHVRYVIPIIPSLCFLVAIMFYSFLQRPAPIRKWAMAALVLFLAIGLVHAEIRILVWRKDVAAEKLIAKKLGELQQAGTQTVLIKAVVPGNDLLWDSFYLFHGNFRFPIIKLTTDEIRANPPKPPLNGACVARDFPVLQQLYPNVQVALSRAQFICWQVPAQ